VAPDGKVAAYRKVYPANFGPFEEGLYFARGEDLTIVDTKIGRIALLICYDSFFPELAKAYAIEGAELLAIISASPATSKPFFDKILPARAIENAMPLVYANLVGTELNIVFQGGTQAIGARGENLGRAEDFVESTITADVDLRDVPTARAFRPTLRDTRKEFWEPVAPTIPVRRAGARNPTRSITRPQGVRAFGATHSLRTEGNAFRVSIPAFTHAASSPGRHRGSIARRKPRPSP